MADQASKLWHSAWLCFHCGADFRGWADLPHETRMDFITRHPEMDIARLQDDRCPRCDAPLTAAVRAGADPRARRAH